jgi:hypothetical protein
MYEVMNASQEFNSALSPLGIEQASNLAVAGASRGRPQPAEVDLIVSSSLRRSIHTAALVFPTAEGYPRPIVCLDEMREFAGPPTSEKRHKRSEIHQLLSTTVDVLGEAVAEVCVTRPFAFSFFTINFNSYLNGGLSTRWRAGGPESAGDQRGQAVGADRGAWQIGVLKG